MVKEEEGGSKKQAVPVETTADGRATLNFIVEEEGTVEENFGFQKIEVIHFSHV